MKNIKKVLPDLNLDKKTIEHIASISNGDLRYAYNLVEFCYYSFGNKFNLSDIKEVNPVTNMFHDKNEDGYYDVLSAFQKSIRGSDVDASLHYLARLIEAGDFDIIYRRMLVIAYEDIGLANPMIGTKVVSAIESAERLGMPELIIPLSSVVIDMALSPKSNSAVTSIGLALNDIRSGKIGNVPNHIKSTSPNYLYPHNYSPNYYVHQQYMPDDLKDKIYYKPRNNKYEKELYEYNKKIKN